MNQPSRAQGDRASGPPGAAAGERPRVLERLRERAAEGERQRAVRSVSWLERLLEWAQGLLRPPVLRHGIAALRRGNPEAAFALLREEVTARPGRAESTLLFWEVAQNCQRPREAAEAMARLLQREVTESRLDTATDHWISLVAQVPEAALDVLALVRILPILRARLGAARGDVAQRLARERLVDALRRSVDPAAGVLPPALALRIVDEARGIDLEVAKRAAQAALTSSSLHEAKRGKLEELLRALERGVWPDAPAEPAAARSAPTPRPAAAPRAAAAPRPIANPAPRSAPPAPSAPPSAARPAPARPAATTPARPSRTVAASHPLAEPSVPTGSPGRRSVALSQDEIEAASMRLAERMAARAAAASGPETVEDPGSDAQVTADVPSVALAEAVAAPVREQEVAAPPAEEPVAEARFLSDVEAESAFGPPLEVDDADLTPERVELPIDDADLPLDDADLQLEIGDGAVALDDDAPDAVAQVAGADVEFEFGAAAEEPAAAREEAPLSESSGPALRAIEITPVELGDDGLVAWEVAHEQRTRVDYRAVEFLAAAEVEGQGDAPLFLVDLVLRARPGRPRSTLRMRADAFDAAALYPDRTDAGQALRALLSDLLERTRAIPLPDPDSALGVRPQRFESLAAFEATILARLSA